MTNISTQRTLSSPGVQKALKMVNAPHACGRCRFSGVGSTPIEEYMSIHAAPRWMMSMVSRKPSMMRAKPSVLRSNVK